MRSATSSLVIASSDSSTAGEQEIQVAIDYDEEDQSASYGFDSFEEMSPLTAVPIGLATFEQGEEEDGEAYGDDDFEDEYDTHVNSPPRDIVDDASTRDVFEQDTVSKCGDVAFLSPSSPSTVEERIVDNTMMLDAWCEQAKHRLKKHSMTTVHLQQCASFELPPVPRLAVDHLIRKVHRHNNRRPTHRKCPNERPLVVVPSVLLDRVRVRQFTSSSSWITIEHDEPCSLEQPKAQGTKSLSTFCSIKQAELEGRLATTRLPDMLARWATDVDDPQSKSVATLEYVQEMTRAQRLVLVDCEEVMNESPNYLFHALRPQTTSSYASTMADAALVNQDSRRLYNQAQRILHEPSAVRCTCFKSSTE